MRAKQSPFLPAALALAWSLAASVITTHAAENTPAPEAPKSGASAKTAAASIDAELHALVDRISAKLRAGQASETALAPELQEFDAMLARHADADKNAVAQIALYKAVLYLQVFENHEKAEAMLQQLVADYPGTEAANAVPRMLAEAKEEAEASRKLAGLIGQPAPALSFEWSSREGLSSLADLKGKVVVLDFWATWCGPCIRSFPEVRELTAHYAGQPVEVVGVTSLQGQVHGLSSQPIDCEGNPAKEYELMTRFIRQKDITWTVAFSKEPVFNPDWGVRGIPYVAIVAPDGTVRHAGLHPASPLGDKTAKIDAILTEFGLKRN